MLHLDLTDDEIMATLHLYHAFSLVCYILQKELHFAERLETTQDRLAQNFPEFPLLQIIKTFSTLLQCVYD